LFTLDVVWLISAGDHGDTRSLPTCLAIIGCTGPIGLIGS
jgi:hypothetical protein